MTILTYQKLIADLVVQHGFDNQTVPEVFTLPIDRCNRLPRNLSKAVEVNAHNQKRTWA